MEEEQVIELINKLRHGEKVLCDVCKKRYFDISGESREFSNYFHCEDPECTGSIHIQKAINVD